MPSVLGVCGVSGFEKQEHVPSPLLEPFTKVYDARGNIYTSTELLSNTKFLVFNKILRYLASRSVHLLHCLRCETLLRVNLVASSNFGRVFKWFATI